MQHLIPIIHTFSNENFSTMCYQEIQKNVSNSFISAWFELNKKSVDARRLTFEEIPQFYSWDQKTKSFRRRQRTVNNRRTSYLPSSVDGNLSLKLLFRYLKGAMNDDDLRTHNGVLYKTYKEACLANGFLEE